MSIRKSPGQRPDKFAYDGLDRIIHERARLSILTSLVAEREGLIFGEVKRLCALTDGNLSRHLQVLSEEGLVDVRKISADGRAATYCRITPAGRKRYFAYIAVLEQVLKDAAAVGAGEWPLFRSLRGAK